jgi:hypothetical protein
MDMDDCNVHFGGSFWWPSNLIAKGREDPNSKINSEIHILDVNILGAGLDLVIL